MGKQVLAHQGSSSKYLDAKATDMTNEKGFADVPNLTCMVYPEDENHLMVQDSFV